MEGKIFSSLNICQTGQWHGWTMEVVMAMTKLSKIKAAADSLLIFNWLF